METNIEYNWNKTVGLLSTNGTALIYEENSPFVWTNTFDQGCEVLYEGACETTVDGNMITWET